MSIDYGHMSPDELVDHFMDEDGIAPFIDIQQKGIPFTDWDWRQITIDLQAFSRGRLTFSPEYLRDLYEMQAQRHVARALSSEAA